GDVWTNSTNVILTLTFNDLTSGVLEVHYSNDGISWSSWETASPTKAWMLSAGDGPSKTVYYEIRDNAGRVSQFYDTIGLDIVNPVGSVIINNDDNWTISSSVTLSLTYSDVTSGVLEVRYSNTGISWSSWEAANPTKAWVLSTGDGSSKAVYYEIKDNAGRVSQFYDTIGLDTVNPDGSIVINSNDDWTISSSVTLNLTYSDVTSGVLEVRYSNDGINWSSWEAANSTKAWVLSTGDGPSKTVYYEIKDNAGRVSQFYDTIGLDTVDPTGSVVINNGDVWTNSTNVILTLIFNDVTSGVLEVRYSNDGITWSSWESAGPTKAWTLSIGDGPSKTVYYEIKDNAGRMSQYADTIGLDTVDPTGSVVINNGDVWTNSTNVILTLTYNDATSGVDQVRYSNDGNLWTSWEFPNETRSWSLTSGDGFKTVYYEIKDKAGLNFQLTDTIDLDTSGPIGSIVINSNDAWTKIPNVTLTLTYNDDVSGIDQVRYSNDGLSWTYWEDPNPNKLWILSIGDGFKTVYYEIRNNAGLTHKTTDTIGLDTVNPTGSIMINNGDTWTNSTNVNFTLTYNDATSGISQVRYSNDGISWSSWEAASPIKTWTLTIGDSPSKTIYYEIRDNAGRVSQYTDTIGLDTVNPDGSIIINNNDDWTISSSVTLSLTYNDITSGISDVRYSNDGITWSSWETASPTKTWILSIGDGFKTVYYKIKDNAGRVSQYTDTIGLDTVDPTGSIIINDESIWTNSTNVILTLTYNDITSGVLEVRYSNDGISWSSWETASPIKAWTLTIGDGSSKTVYYEIKDNAGRVSQYMDTIGLDTVDPTGSVLINNGDVWTNSTNVILTLTYNDATSGIDQVRYSYNGTLWTSWEFPNETRSWSLTSGDGSSKTVYYEIRDNAGRVSQYTDTIGLDTIDPTGSVVINNGDVWTNSTNVILTLTFNDLTSGVLEVRYSNDGISWSSWEAANPTKAWVLSTGDSSSKA
ncbi:MAG: hypothetical protein P8Y97_17340, partial [Candidatus Lokiarchaeota archaeon]